MDFDLPDDLKDDVEVVYLDDEAFEYDDENEIMEEFDGAEEQIQTEVVDLSKYSFSKHTRSVFTCALSKDASLAVTGGEDDVALVWSLIDGSIVLECTGHKDSVTEVTFNFDDQYLATGDMGGLIQVWNIKMKNLLWCYEGDDMEWLCWHHFANVLLSGSQSGDVYIWQIPQGNCKVLASHGSPASCGKLLPDGKQLLVGYGDGKIKLWDIKSNAVLWQGVSTSETAITSLDVTNDGTLLVAAPTAQLFKMSDGHLINILLSTSETEIEVAVFNSESGLLATGSLSGKICVWDIARCTLRHETKINSSVTVLKWGSNSQLYIGASDGTVFVMEGRTGILLETLTGHTSDVFSLSLSKDGSFILTTSDDGTAKIFQVKPNSSA